MYIYLISMYMSGRSFLHTLWLLVWILWDTFVWLLWWKMPENSTSDTPCGKTSGKPDPLGKNLWGLHCLILGITLFGFGFFWFFVCYWRGVAYLLIPSTVMLLIINCSQFLFLIYLDFIVFWALLWMCKLASSLIISYLYKGMHSHYTQLSFQLSTSYTISNKWR